MKSTSFAPKILPDAKEKIESKLKKLKIVPRNSLDKAISEKKHIFHSLCLDDKGRKYFFKARLWDDIAIKNSFSNEINTFAFLNKNVKTTDYFNFHKILDWGKGKIDWLLLKFIEANPLLSSRKIDDRMTDLIVEGLLYLHKIPYKPVSLELLHYRLILDKYRFITIGAPKINLSERDTQSTRYRKQIDFCLKGLKNIVPEKVILQFIDKRLDLLNEEKLVFSHGDFALKNMLFDSKRLFLLDWENTQLHSPAYDLACLCTTDMDNSSWLELIIRKFIKHLSKREEFTESFSLMLILLCIYKIYFVVNNPHSKQEEKRNLKRWRKIINQVLYNKIL